MMTEPGAPMQRDPFSMSQGESTTTPRAIRCRETCATEERL